MIKKTMIICLMAVMGVITASAQSVYDFKVKDDAGSDVQLELNPTLSTIMARRSVRKYQAKVVEHDKLEVVARAGINAPSGMNRQPWIVRVVEDQQLIADVNKAAGRSLFYDAPNLICVCTPAAGGGELDAGLLGENMMLAAQALGLNEAPNAKPRDASKLKFIK